MVPDLGISAGKPHRAVSVPRKNAQIRIIPNAPIKPGSPAAARASALEQKCIKTDMFSAQAGRGADCARRGAVGQGAYGGRKPSAAAQEERQEKG